MDFLWSLLKRKYYFDALAFFYDLIQTINTTLIQSTVSSPSALNNGRLLNRQIFFYLRCSFCAFFSCIFMISSKHVACVSFFFFTFNTIKSEIIHLIKSYINEYTVVHLYRMGPTDLFLFNTLQSEGILLLTYK